MTAQPHRYTHIASKSRYAAGRNRPTLEDRTAELVLDDKPQGLWYSVDGHWEEWCASEMPEWLIGKRYSVDLGESRILRCADALDVRLFFAPPSSAKMPALAHPLAVQARLVGGLQGESEAA